MTDTTHSAPTAPPTDLDYGSLRAMLLNCTLTRSPGESHTARLMGAVATVMRAQGVTVDELRAVDHPIAEGIAHDMTEGDDGVDRDAWPEIFERVRAADILVLGTPLWLGEKSSVCTRVMERLYGSSGRFNERGQFAFYGKAAGWVITGNEDGVKHASMNLAFSLSHIGYTVPPNGDAGWIGEIGPGKSFGDDDEVGLDNPFTHRNVSLMAWNLMHGAAILKAHGGIPAWGTAMERWTDGERFGTPSLRSLVSDAP